MAISGAFAGLAGTLDMIGGAQNYQVGQLDIPFIQVGFIGIAVALLGRNTAIGTLLGALLFGALTYGSFQGLGSSTVISPTLANNLPYIIQGLIVLFIGANASHSLRVEFPQEAQAAARRKSEAAAGVAYMNAWTTRLDNPFSTRLRDGRLTGVAGIVLGVSPAFIAIPPIEARTVIWPIVVGLIAAMLGIWTVARGRRRLGWGAVAAGLVGIGLGILATRSSTANLGAMFDATLVAQTLSFSTPLTFAAMGGIFSERSGVVNIGLRRADAHGRLLGRLQEDKGGSWAVGLGVAAGVGALFALVYAFFAIHLRADQIVGGTGINFLAVGITGYFFIQLYNNSNVPFGVSSLPVSTSSRARLLRYSGR